MMLSEKDTERNYRASYPYKKTEELILTDELVLMQIINFHFKFKIMNCC